MARVPEYSRRLAVVHNYPAHRGEEITERVRQLYGRFEDRVTIVDSRPLEEDGVFWNLTRGNEYLFGGGSHQKLSGPENDTLRQVTFDFIRHVGQPAMGICFGAQAIMRAHGGNIQKMPQKIDGPQGVVLDSPVGELPAGSEFSARVIHNFGMYELPEGLEAVAHNIGEGIEGRSPVIQAFIGREALVAGTQFHPEIDSDNYPDAVSVFAGLRQAVLDVQGRG